MRSIPAIALPLVALLAVACGPAAGSPAATGPAASPAAASPTASAAPSGGAGVPTAAVPTAAVLDGRTWVVTGAQGHDLPLDSRLAVTFADGGVSVSGGCNGMNGSVEIIDGTLTVGPMMSTEMACQPPLMALDQWIGAFLPGATASLDGATLTLVKSGVTVTLTDREVALPDRPLAGTQWVVDGLVSASAVSSVPAGVRATLRFTADTVAVDTGCNTGSGSATSTDAVITFGPIALTRMACDAAATSVEQAVTRALAGEQPYAIVSDTLTIGGNGTDGLVLKAAR